MKIRCIEIGPGCDGRFEMGGHYEFDVENQGIYNQDGLILPFPRQIDSVEDWNRSDNSDYTQIAKFKEVFTVMTKEEVAQEIKEANKELAKARKLLEATMKRVERAEQAELIMVKYDRWPNLADGVLYFVPELKNGLFVPVEKKFSMSAWVENESYVNWVSFTVVECQRDCDMLNFHGTTRRMALQMDGHLGYGFDTQNKCYTPCVDLETKELTATLVANFEMQQPLIALMTKETAVRVSADAELIGLAKSAWNS